MAEPPSAPLPIHGMRSEELVARAAARLSRGAGAARRVYRQVMLEGRFAPEELGLAAETSAGWRAAFDFELPELVRLVEEPSETGKTAKAVLRLADGLEAECVLIPMGRGRQTLCVSSQVGCKMGCSFCETARMGLMRQLAPHEIVAQLLVARHVLGWSVRNVVFMGMGEALDDFDSLHQVLRILLDSAGLSIAQERLTVCTVGRVDGIERLAQTGLKRLNLSISLNSADPRRREELMPVSRRFPLEALQAALVAYRPRRNFALGVNYCLMPGLNDRREDARLVAAFCAPIGRVLLNLIPYNPGGRPLCRAPTEEEVERFVAWLREEGLPVRRRVTKGRSVMAACGQLGNVTLRRSRADARGMRGV